MIKNYFFKCMLAAFIGSAAMLGTGCSSNDDNGPTGPEEDDAIAVNYATVDYYTADAGANYYLKLSTAELDQNGKVKGAGDVYYLDIYSTAPEADAIRMPAAGTYTLDAQNSLVAGTIASSQSSRVTYTFANDIATPGDEVTFTDAELVVSHSGNTFSVTAQITLKTGETVKLKSKAIPGIEKSTGIGDEVMMVGSEAEAGYLSVTEPGVTGYMLNIYGESGEDYVSLLFLGAQAPFSAGIPEGTFMIDAETTVLEPGVGIPGMDDEGQPFGCYYSLNDTAFAYLNTGEIFIEKNEDGTYYVSVMGETEDGKIIMVDYGGAIELYPGYSTLEGDKVLNLSSISTGQATSYKDDFDIGLGDWVISLDSKTANIDGLRIELLAPNPTSTAIPLGTFTGSANMEENSFFPGEVQQEGQSATIYPSFYFTTTAGGDIQDFAPIGKGTITIAKPNTNYQITVDVYDDCGNHITGTWIGALQYVDGTSSSAPAKSAIKPVKASKQTPKFAAAKKQSHRILMQSRYTR